MNTRKLLLLAGVLLATLPVLRAAGLAGKWTAEFDTQVGIQKYVYEFKADGDKFTGKATFEREQGKGEVALRDIKVSGDEVSFGEPLKFEDQEIPITYKGKIVGDEMQLTRNVGDFATEPLVAKRVKDTPAKPPAPPAGAK
jgi:hypothetical protein